MVQWFSPGFSAYIQRFETRLTSGIILDAGMSWRVQDLFVLCCRQVRFCPRPESHCVSLRFVVKRRIWNRTIHNFQYCTRHNINSYVGYRRLLALESKSSSVDRLTLNPVKDKNKPVGPPRVVDLRWISIFRRLRFSDAKVIRADAPHFCPTRSSVLYISTVKKNRPAFCFVRKMIYVT